MADNVGYVNLHNGAVKIRMFFEKASDFSGVFLAKKRKEIV